MQINILINTSASLATNVVKKSRAHPHNVRVQKANVPFDNQRFTAFRMTPLHRAKSGSQIRRAHRPDKRANLSSATSGLGLAFKAGVVELNLNGVDIYLWLVCVWRVQYGHHHSDDLCDMGPLRNRPGSVDIDLGALAVLLIREGLFEPRSSSVCGALSRTVRGRGAGLLITTTRRMLASRRGHSHRAGIFNARHLIASRIRFPSVYFRDGPRTSCPIA
jgi:hypothetical protein